MNAQCHENLLGNVSENPRAHKNKIGTPPPPKTPPQKSGILRTWFFLQKERIFPGVHKIGAPITGPRIADTNFTDTRIFLNVTCDHLVTASLEF